MNSGTSTDAAGRVRRDAGFTPRHLYLLLAMAGATWAVVVAEDTHPAALLLLSGAVLAAGLTGAFVHEALVGFLAGRASRAVTLSKSARQGLEEDKALVLRSIKELEFDRSMGKVSDADFAVIDGRLRARALDLMEALEQLPDEVPPAPPGDPGAGRPADGAANAQPGVAGRFCGQCGAPRETGARFCIQCGTELR